MAITEDGSGNITYSEPPNKRRSDQTGTAVDNEFAVVNRTNVMKQVQFSINPTSNVPGTLTLQCDVGSDATLNLTNLSPGTVNSFTVIQPDSGTSPTASSSTDTLTLHSTATPLTITGNSSTKTITFGLSLNNTNILVGNASNIAAGVSVSGDLSITNAGVTTVNTVGGSSAANINTAEVAANAATSSNTVSTIVKRDSSGNFSAGTITASLTGHASLDLAKTGGTMSGAINMGSNLINSVTDPVSAQDAATKNYVDNVAAAGVSKSACVYATAAALPANTYNNGSSGVGATLTGISFGALVVDGNTVSTGQRILVKNEVSQANNGIYVVTTVGAVATLYVLTRATDFNSSTDIVDGATTFVTSGATLSATTWELNVAGVVTVGSTSLPFNQIAGPGTILAGTGLSITGSTISLISPVVIANGGTNATTANTAFNNLSPMTTLGDTIYGGSSGAGTRLAGNTTTTKKFQTQTGDGVNSTAPGWNTIIGSDLPNPSSSTLGGIQSYAAVANQWINTISTSGVPGSTQPAFSNISGTAAVTQGGTGLTTCTTGDLFYGSGSNTISKLAAGTNLQILRQKSGIPAWDNVANISVEDAHQNSFESLPTTTISSGIFLAAVSGTGATVANFAAPNGSNQMGVVDLQTGTTNTGIARLTSGSATMIFGNGSFTQEWVVHIPTASDGTDTYAIQWGCFDTNTLSPTNAAGLVYSTATSANFLTQTSDNTTRTTTTSSTAVPIASWFRITMIANAAGTSISWYLNDVLIGSNTTNIPTASGRTTKVAQCMILKSAGTNSRSVYVDAYSHLFRPGTAR